MILAGDIGGTKTNIALFDAGAGVPGPPLVQERFSSNGFDSLEAILAEFARRHGRDSVTRACFGVAGPVVGGAVDATNLAWDVRADSVARSLGLERVALINDLEATAYGLEVLHDEQLFTLSEGAGGREGHRALIAAGTGLGMAGLFWDGGRHRPVATEGGHIDFAPRNEIEFGLLRHVRQKIGGRVSYERVLSGMGLAAIYEFLRDEGHAEEPAWLSEQVGGEDAGAAISAAALAGRSELAAMTLDLFVQIYGAMAGNLALLWKPEGGLYVGGGIAPKILDKLREGAFMRAYRDKGRMTPIVEAIPVRVVLDDRAALYGAARCAQLGG
jgi:glucokinase